MKLFICFAAFGFAFGKPLAFEITNERKFFLDENSKERLTDFDTEFEKTDLNYEFSNDRGCLRFHFDLIVLGVGA